MALGEEKKVERNSWREVRVSSAQRLRQKVVEVMSEVWNKQTTSYSYCSRHSVMFSTQKEKNKCEGKKICPPKAQCLSLNELRIPNKLKSTSSELHTDLRPGAMLRYTTHSSQQAERPRTTTFTRPLYNKLVLKKELLISYRNLFSKHTTWQEPELNEVHV